MTFYSTQIDIELSTLNALWIRGNLLPICDLVRMFQSSSPASHAMLGRAASLNGYALEQSTS